MNQRINLIIKGRVQGVFFRASTRDVARRLRIYGWVKNNWDGSVEVEAEGSEEDVKRFVDWCKKGPPVAYVEEVKVTEMPFSGDFDRFDIKY